MNIDELWIGDLVFAMSIGENVAFEGRHDDQKSKVKWDNKVFILPNADLTLAKKEKTLKPLLFHDNDIHVKKEAPAKEIDLHFDKLFPNERSVPQVDMLRRQLEKFDRYMQDVIDYKWHQVLVIHGKGQGILKSEVEARLNSMREVRFAIDKHNGGAKEVWLIV